MTDAFRTLLRVRYYECDAQKVVFNARYADYVDTVTTEFMRVLFGGYDKLMAQGIDYQVVRLLTEWQSPARFDNVLAISVETEKVGNSSFTLALRFKEYFSDREVATAEITYVAVSASEFTKILVPDFMREKLLLGAPGQVLNYAGIDLNDKAP